MNRKQNLLENLREQVFCKVGRSDINGVGVIAIKDIPLGATVFNFSNYRPERDELVDISEKEAESLSVEVLELIKSYTAMSHLNTYAIHENGLNHLNLGYYLNHSDNPNIRIHIDENTKEYQYANFIAIKEIKKGEELTENYKHLCSDAKNLKKQFDFLN